MDNSIYVLDNNVVLQITENGQVPLCLLAILFQINITTHVKGINQ